MAHLIIQNLGAISNIDIVLNKVNIFIGPQSSGKSTIAKVISYCQWVEKRCILDGEYNEDFAEKFMEFHRISDSYFHDDSYIKYESDSIFIEYKGRSHKQTIEKTNDGLSYKNSKNIYIPAERNFVSAIDNLRKYKRTNDNIMNFVYDWAEVRDNYPSENKYSVLDLNVSYYYILDSDTDMLLLNEGQKELKLNYASSGLQSLIPLLLPLEYMTGKLFDIKNTESVDEKSEILNIFSKYFSQVFDETRRKEISEQLQEEAKTNRKSFSISLKNEETEKLYDILRRRREYHFSQFIFEEPEQNLFPKTQRDLVYYMLQKITAESRDHRLLLTTHSPFILQAFNNCMMGYLVKDKMPQDEQKELLNNISYINPSLVSAYEITKEGTLKSIQNEKTGTIGKHYFNRMTNEIMNEYYDMLNYLDIDDNEK